MNSFFSLIKLNIKTLLNSFKFATKVEKIRSIFLNLIGLIFFISSYIISYQVVIYISTLPVIGTLFVIRILALGFLASFLMLFFSSLIVPFSTMFEAEDLEFLFSLPINYEYIFFNKLILTAIRASWMVLVVFIPFVIAFAVVKNFSLFEVAFLIISVLLKVFISTSIGIALAILLSYIFPSKKLKNIVLVVFIVSSSLIYSLFRFSQPEKMLFPENFQDFFSYLDFLSKPVAKSLPSWWITEIFNGLMTDNKYLVAINFIKLTISLILIFLIFLFFLKRIFYKCFFLSYEKTKHKNFVNKTGELFNIKSVFSVIAAKETRIFLREPIQWAQFIIVTALSLVYIFNISKLPLDLKHVKVIVAFFNLGGIMFILTAIVLRFIFVQPSLEYKMFWLIKSLPISLKNIFFIKFLVYFPFVLIPGLVLVILSNLVICVEKELMFLSIIIILCACIVLPLAGYSLGILFPKKDYKDIAQIETSFGGLMFIILSLCYIILSLSSIAEPVRKYILGIQIFKIEMLIHFIIFFIINFVYAFTPVYYSKRKFIEEY